MGLTRQGPRDCPMVAAMVSDRRKAIGNLGNAILKLQVSREQRKPAVVFCLVSLQRLRNLEQ